MKPQDYMPGLDMSATATMLDTIIMLAVLLALVIGASWLLRWLSR